MLNRMVTSWMLKILKRFVIVDRYYCITERSWVGPFVGLFVGSIALASSSLAVVHPLHESRTVVRFAGEIDRLKLSPTGAYLAYVTASTGQLRVLHNPTKKVYDVLNGPADQVSYFWAADGSRLFIRTLRRSHQDGPTSSLKIFDAHARRLIDVESLEFATGLPTYDPSDSRVRLLHSKGIVSRKLHYPGKRLGKWQRAQTGGVGFFLAAQHGILWVTHAGHRMRRLADDDTGLQSFAISPDGRAIVWSTKGERIYLSHADSAAVFVDHGKDPAWHPVSKSVIYSGARMIGKVPVNFDVKMRDPSGRTVWLTDTQSLDERWPQWLPGGRSVVFTRQRTGDVFAMDLTK